MPIAGQSIRGYKPGRPKRETRKADITPPLAYPRKPPAINTAVLTAGLIRLSRWTPRSPSGCTMAIPIPLTTASKIMPPKAPLPLGRAPSRHITEPKISPRCRNNGLRLSARKWPVKGWTPLHVKYITAMTRPPIDRLNENSARIAGRIAGSILAKTSIKK